MFEIYNTKKFSTTRILTYVMKNVSRTLQERFGDPIGSYAGDAPVGVRSVEEAEACPHCGMMPVDGECGCGSECMDCGCAPCECGMDLDEGAEPCAECGMLEVGGSCGCTHMDEVTPPGKEKMVRALKKDPDIDSPWAVAWAAHGKQKQG
jgi:hypothetical protein